MNVELPLFRVPLLERFAEVSTRGSRTSVMVVDGVGLFVKHDPDQMVTHDLVRRCLIGVKHNVCLVEAKSVSGAVEKFLNEWEGARTGGGRGPASFALRIDPSRPIVKLPFCENLHRNRTQEFICGPEAGQSGNGEFGMCVLQGYDSPEECPIARFYEEHSGFESKYDRGEVWK